MICHLRTLRTAQGLSQCQLAGLARSSERAVRKLERGDLDGLRVGTLIRLAGALGVGAADVLPVLGSVLPGREVTERPRTVVQSPEKDPDLA